MRVVDLIRKKRDGGVLTASEIRYIIQGYVKGSIPDYQISALMMAIYFQGMNKEETLLLVSEMVNSGDQIDLSGIAGSKVDKHSTGGVGDKTSLVLGPLVAAAGVPVAKMTGRGLGHTGGTIDKLESIPGFSVSMSQATFIRQIQNIGIAIAGQTATLAPADKKLYALRDVTATIENISLIAGSIMSKKLACGADAIVLDVKTGSGAFMKTEEDAFKLAKEMVEIGKGVGKRTVALVTSMDQPLGNTVGNALEVKEAIATLRGEGPEDLEELCLALGSKMLVLGGVTKTSEDAVQVLKEKIASGEAFAKFEQLVREQGGDIEVLRNTERMVQASVQYSLKAETSGYITEIVAEKVGQASMLLGAGRANVGDKIDPAAGIELMVKCGAYVGKDEIIAVLHCADTSLLSEAMPLLRSAYQIESQKPTVSRLIRGVVK